MPDRDQLATTVRALLRFLRDDGVPAADLVGVVRAGILLVAIREGVGGGVEALRAWLMTCAPAPGVPACPDLTRYLKAADARWPYLVVLWRQAADARPTASADAVFAALWAAVDSVEGARMVATLEAG
ncbi:MAG: hypothetical protein HYY95_07925 [Candidatus Rokubacteria bacterium]|nr:hypothetical protein [Candidatus Rokubacteria bacterium]MBI3105484.1 hypothetical protein [Candidatus Rokubacteria bacterium]